MIHSIMGFPQQYNTYGSGRPISASNNYEASYGESPTDATGTGGSSAAVNPKWATGTVSIIISNS